LNAVVGVSQETSAEKAIAALQEYSANEAKVVRNGHIKRIKAEELVPGDVISVAIGDRIPADCRVLSIQSNSFNVDQSILTGESESVSKDVKAIKDADAVKQDQVNMLFSGTTVVTGHATALVVLTGANTAIGDIHESITSQISQPTPLKEKLNDFGDMLAKVITVICILVWLINFRNFSDPSHGSFAKGAIYYLKVCRSLPPCTYSTDECRSQSLSVWQLSRKASLSLLPPVWLSAPGRWLLETPSFEAYLLWKLWEAAVSSVLTRQVH
jgi:Ca2+ transporting ATPase